MTGRKYNNSGYTVYRECSVTGKYHTREIIMFRELLLQLKKLQRHILRERNCLEGTD